MGCAQTLPSVIPMNHHMPIERILVNEDYSLAQALPVVMITVPPPPSYVKSALKRNPFDGRRQTEKPSLFNRRLPSLNKCVNFDEQVLVKERTPTPTKVWYEKASSTMPMRKTPRNDDDDYDYDQEEINSPSSDEEVDEDNNNNDDDDEPNDFKQKMFTLRPPTPLAKRNQGDALWSRNNTVGVMPQINPLLENQSFSPSIRRSSLNTNTSALEPATISAATRIKVRRKLPDEGLPPIVPVSPYQSPVRPPIAPPYQSPVRLPIASPYQSPVQPPIAPPYQSPVRLPIAPSYQSPVQPPIVSPYPSVVKPPSQVFPLQPVPSNPLTNGEPSPQTPYYPVARHPIENVT
jgi:hypothetical protein